MFFQHIYEKGLAQASYIVGCQKNGTAVVIDPKRDIDTYLDIAEREKLKITHVAETHIHADFLSGARDLAAATGAEIMLSDEGGAEWAYEYDHTGLRDGDSFWVGNLKFEVMHTPGHTPEHISYLLTDTATGDQPVMLFSGDFVFVGDVGRPDLLQKAAGLQGTQLEGAKQMFTSLKKFSKLSDHIQVWPAHGAGSACGKALGAVPSTTVGYEKLFNWALQINDEQEFIDTLLEGQPEPPTYFGMMKKLNKQGPAILGGIPHPARLTLTQFQQALDNGVLVVDTRDKFAYAGGHIKGSINIQNNNAFSTWAGWILDYEKPFVLIGETETIEPLTRALIRIGLDQIQGYLPNLTGWSEAGHELETVNQITVEELKDKTGNGHYQVVDVRGYSEYAEGHIPGAVNIHAGYLTDELDRLPDDKTIVVHCVSGDRSAIASGLLQRLGVKNVVNLTGGFNAWTQAGLDVETETA
jgi:hydroxyacylglutathione hydrolase